MSYKIQRFEQTNPNQMPTGWPRAMNRVLGKFGILLVDDEKPQIISTMASPEDGWVIVSFGNPKTGEITNQIEVPRGSRLSRTTEGFQE